MTQVGSTTWIVIGWIALAIGFACACVIAWDIVVGRHRQQMAIMNAVWPITALYFGPVAVWFYFRRGRRTSHRWAREHGDAEADAPRWWSTAMGVSHCGAGCTVGDIVGEWIIYLTAWTIAIFASHAANSLMAMYVADFVLAWSFGIVFQYFSIVPMREEIGRAAGIWQAVKADTLSIVAFQIGLFGFMALVHLVFWQPPLSVASPVYWLMMQIGMVVGYFTAWPANVWLVERGVKERM